MIHAYNQIYLEDAMNAIGTMLDCAANVEHCNLSVFYEMFIASGIASQIENGNVRYVSGMSGVELMQCVLKKTSDRQLSTIQYVPFDRTPEFWVGWVLAYYQWYSNLSFHHIQHNGLDIKTVVNLYPTLHEADLSKFAQTANTIIGQNVNSIGKKLKNIRKQLKLTQKELAEQSGVTLRMIQAYEQGDQNILKAEYQTVFSLSRVLGCSPEFICG